MISHIRGSSHPLLLFFSSSLVFGCMLLCDSPLDYLKWISRFIEFRSPLLPSVCRWAIDLTSSADGLSSDLQRSASNGPSAPLECFQAQLERHSPTCIFLGEVYFFIISSLITFMSIYVLYFSYHIYSWIYRLCSSHGFKGIHGGSWFVTLSLSAVPIRKVNLLLSSVFLVLSTNVNIRFSTFQELVSWHVIEAEDCMTNERNLDFPERSAADSFTTNGGLSSPLVLSSFWWRFHL